MEAELGPEQRGFVEGCPAERAEMPIPGPPVTVGIDGGTMRSWADRPSNFEVIAGPVRRRARGGRHRGADATLRLRRRPRRQAPPPSHEVLREQGASLRREVTFLSDGGKGVRDLRWDMRPNAEHVLDCFRCRGPSSHIAMRVTVMQQIARGLPPAHDEIKAGIVARLERVRLLRHGHKRRALEIISDVEEDALDLAEPDGLIEPDEGPPAISPQAIKLLRRLREFDGTITDDARMIPDQAERRRNGEVVSTAFVETTVNQVMAKRCGPGSSRCRPPRGVHLLLRLRTRTLDRTLGNVFAQWRQERGTDGSHRDQAA